MTVCIRQLNFANSLKTKVFRIECDTCSNLSTVDSH